MNTLMERGNRLEAVAKWLGHKNPCITYRHCAGRRAARLPRPHWTHPVPTAPTAPAPEAQAAEEEAVNASMYEALRAKVEECDLLGRMLLALAAEAPAES